MLDIIHEERCELGHILRASSDERDWYTAAGPYEWKRFYLEHMQPLHGWAMYVIRPNISTNRSDATPPGQGDACPTA